MDGSGNVTEDELKLIGTISGCTLTTSQVSQLLKDMDIDGDGSIIFEEFRHWAIDLAGDTAKQVGFPPLFPAIFNRKMRKLPLFSCILLRNEGKTAQVLGVFAKTKNDEEDLAFELAVSRSRPSNLTLVALCIVILGPFWVSSGCILSREREREREKERETLRWIAC